MDYAESARPISRRGFSFYNITYGVLSVVSYFFDIILPFFEQKRLPYMVVYIICKNRSQDLQMIDELIRVFKAN